MPTAGLHRIHGLQSVHGGSVRDQGDMGMAAGGFPAVLHPLGGDASGARRYDRLLLHPVLTARYQGRGACHDHFRERHL